MNLDVAIIGGGLAGLSVAFELRRRRPDLRLGIFEREPRPGGRIGTTSEGGYTFDWGPNGIIPAPATVELLRALGLEGELQPAAPAARRRYLFHGGRLQPVPSSPAGLLSTRLLTPGGKLRALAEPLLASRRFSGGEETVFSFAARHFGPQAAALASTAVLGIAAADGRDVSLDALFPRTRALEREHGSLLRGMVRGGRKRRGSSGSGESGGSDVSGEGDGSGGSSTKESRRLTTFPGGMERLVERLAAAIGAETLRTGSEVQGLAQVDGGFELRLGGDESVHARSVVLTPPAPVSARLLGSSWPALARPLSLIEMHPVDVLVFAFERHAVPLELDGFGLLISRGEGLRSLGVLWTSSLFADRAPAGQVLLRVIAGGAADPGFADLSDEEARRVALSDLRATMGITAGPLRFWRVAHKAGLPHYSLGHGARVDEAFGALPPGMVLAGDSYKGLGVNSVVADAERVAEQVIKQFNGPGHVRHAASNS